MPTTVTRRHLDLAGLDVPVVELAGAHDGPLLTVIAGVHGCEYVPMAAVREWTRDLERREISGRIRAVPVLNVTAFRARSPFVVPEDGKNLNRCFPGDPDGTLAERLAYAAFTQLISGSDAVIDAHCGDMVEALEPFALYEAGPAEAAARGLALAYGLGYVIRQEAEPDRAVTGSSSGAAAQAGIPAITAEAGGCGVVERHAVDTHLRGLNATLAHLGMAAPVEPIPAHAEPAVLGRFLWLRCAEGGWWAPAAVAGEHVSEGQVLGTVSSLDGSSLQETITAPADGVIMFLTSSPAVADDGLLLGLGAS
ncbi:MAG: succinylglutamate desuccinylase/aspartoacylase family protein [Streptosporangiaceae bacterium]